MRLSTMILPLLFVIIFLSNATSWGAQESMKEEKSPIMLDDRNLPRDYDLMEPIKPVKPAIFPAESSVWQQAGEGMRRKVFFNDRLTMVLLEIDRPLKQGEKLTCHYHVHEQITYVLEGRIRVQVDEEVHDIGSGGCYVVPSNIHHGILPLTRKVIIMDVFTPAREDFRPAAEPSRK
jgi:quercetin dioxygenase-like cupin family protein